MSQKVDLTDEFISLVKTLNAFAFGPNKEQNKYYDKLHDKHGSVSAIAEFLISKRDQALLDLQSNQ